MYHGGGLLVGSSEIVPAPQVEWLASNNFLVVIPNYRLAPQVSGKVSFADAEEAYEWATTGGLPGVMESSHGFAVDTSRVVVMGHSTGGTLALHMASTKAVKAVTAFYPSLYIADDSTSAHKPTSAPPFGDAPDFEPSDAEWNEIKPADRQISEFPLAPPGVEPKARNKWQMHILKHGEWVKNVAPDGGEELAALDPMTRISTAWPAVMILQGDQDNVPGSSLELAQRAEKEMKDSGVEEVKLRVVEGAAHMFDLPPTIGTKDKGDKWQAVVEGLEWLRSHVRTEE